MESAAELLEEPTSSSDIRNVVRRKRRRLLSVARRLVKDEVEGLNMTVPEPEAEVVTKYRLSSGDLDSHSLEDEWYVIAVADNINMFELSID